MATIYRDYGYMNGDAVPSNRFEVINRGQVYQATHNGAGVLLPSRLRSFISFSFGGKNIEDFDLIACSEGNTLSRAAYAPFEDLTSDYNIMDGQYYHGTHFKPNTLALKLVSDGIDQAMLDSFLHWFKGGMTRELILAEHPNRAIMARVASAPQLNLTGFEKPFSIVIGGIERKTSTTVYRGFINLELVADQPFWYAKQNFITNDNGVTLFLGKDIYQDTEAMKEAVKAIYEDTIPLQDMVQSTMHFGTNSYALVGTNIAYTVIAGPINSDNPTEQPEDWDATAQGFYIYNGEYWKGARIDGELNNTTYLGRISGAYVADEDSIVNAAVNSGESGYNFFYGGTAPSPTVLSFKVDLTPSESGQGYIDCIANEYVKGTNNKPYSTITIKSVHEKNFDFTTPNIITSWNKARKIFNGCTGENWKDLSDTIRDDIRHPAVRAWAISIVTYLNNNGYTNSNGEITSSGKDKGLEILDKFFCRAEKNNNFLVWTTGFGNMEFEFDAENCTAIGKVKYWKANSSDIDIVSTILNKQLDNVSFSEHEEDVGDMLRSNWLFIEDHNTFNSDGLVMAYTELQPTNSHIVSHNAKGALIGLKIKYQNRYL